MSPLVELRDVTVAFGGVKAMDDVSFTLSEKAGITGIIGPNGAGKSTCLSVIAGARRPTSGHVSVLGRPLGRRTNTASVSRHGVVRTFQIPRPFVDMTIRENVEVAMLAGGRTRRSAKAAEIDDLLERMGLQDSAAQPAGSLPLAARKKLEVARAMATKPELLLLDEVFEGLSDVEIQDLISILRSLDDDGVRLLLVEHVLRALRQLATSLIVFEKGAVIAEGELNEVLDSHRVREAYLGVGADT